MWLVRGLLKLFCVTAFCVGVAQALQVPYSKRNIASRFLGKMAARETVARAAAASGGGGGGSLGDLASLADHSWLQKLQPDPDAARHSPNKKSREVKSGHWVPVLPSPLPSPRLVKYSPSMAAELGLSKEACETGTLFARFFSGDLVAAAEAEMSASTSSTTAPVSLDPKAYAADPLEGSGVPLKVMKDKKTI